MNENKDYEKFVHWVADFIFTNDDCDYDLFVELICRKLYKLGLVTTEDNKWELIEGDESNGINRYS